MRTVSAVEPVRVTLADGKERKFLLTRGGITRLKRALEIESDRQLLEVPQEKILGLMLLEAQQVADGDEKLTAESLPDLQPMDLEWGGQVIITLLGVSLPDPRPTTAPQTTAPNA